MDINIKDLLASAGKKLKSDFEYLKETNPHYAERGAEAQEILIKFLNIHLPKRYAASSGIIIDNQNYVSPQIDVIVYDSVNSPVYRKDERVMILPSDNVAAAIEVKSNLSKKELADAAEKIKKAKNLNKTPITNVDQEVTKGGLTITQSLGVVFAYTSSTSLETLSENLVEINKDIDAYCWVDLVVVLDKGIISYAVKQPLNPSISGSFGGIPCPNPIPIPYYITLGKLELGENTINEFLTRMLSHLTFFRKRSSVDLSAVMGGATREMMAINSYQLNSKGEVSLADEDHMPGKFHFGSNIYFYKKEDNKYLGSMGLVKWKDGSVIFYSGHIIPFVVISPFYKACKIKEGQIFPAGGNANDWVSIVLPMQVDMFEKVAFGDLSSVLAKKGVVVSRECNIPGMAKE